jgi:hypothetical protein
MFKIRKLFEGATGVSAFFVVITILVTFFFSKVKRHEPYKPPEYVAPEPECQEESIDDILDSPPHYIFPEPPIVNPPKEEITFQFD